MINKTNVCVKLPFVSDREVMGDDIINNCNLNEDIK